MKREEFIVQVNSEQKQLRRFLLALCCGDKDEADDIAQEALIKAYLSSSAYRNEGKFTAWLYKIAHHTFLDRRKSLHYTEDIDEARTLYLKAVQDRQLRRYKQMTLVAFVLGIVGGGALFYFITQHANAIASLPIDTTIPALSFLAENGAMILSSLIVLLICYALVSAMNLIQELTMLKRSSY